MKIFIKEKPSIETLEERCEICLKLAIKTLHLRHSRVFLVNFYRISHLFILFSIDDFEEINFSGERKHWAEIN